MVMKHAKQIITAKDFAEYLDGMLDVHYNLLRSEWDAAVEQQNRDEMYHTGAAMQEVAIIQHFIKVQSDCIEAFRE